MKCTFTAVLLLVGMRMAAQSPAYNQFTTREGISGNTVYCGVQDKKGFLWFGTDKGLSRFDGTRFEQFGVEEGLPDPEVLELFSDSEGDLWISCFKVNVCRRKNGVIQSAANEPVMAKIALKSSIVNVSEDNSGKKWVTGKDYCIYSLDGDSVTQKKFPTFIATVFQMNGDLFAIQPDGVFKLSNDGDILKTIPVNTGTPHPFGTFYNCVVSGDLLLMSSPYLMLFRREGETFRLLEENKKLSGKLFKDSKGQIWLGSPFNGAIRFQPGLPNLTDYEQYLPGKRINTVIEDNQGGFWFGTIGEGVFRLSPNGARIYNLSDGITPVNVTALCAQPEGGILATDDRGMIYNTGTSPHAPIPLPGGDQYNKSRAIVRTSDRTYWIGADKGLFKYANGKTQKFAIPAAIKAMVSRNDSIWIGSANSIYVLPAGTDVTQNLVAERITALCIDREGFIWSGGTSGIKCDQQQFKYNWAEQFPALNNKIIALGTGLRGYIWVVTPQDGLLRVRTEKGAILGVEPMQHYFKGALKNVQSLFCEPSGRVWLATNQGIYTLGTDLQTQYFGLHDGLVNQDVNCIVVTNDTLWAGTVAGITAIPLSSAGRTNPVPVLFSAVRYRTGTTQQVFNLLDSSVLAPVCKVPHSAGLVEVVFSVQDFNGLYGQDFECAIVKLLPPLYLATFDNLYQWVKNGLFSTTETGRAENGVLQFGLDLPPGKYMIKAYAKTKTGNNSSESAWLMLEKHPAWYETMLFWLIFWSVAAWFLFKILSDRNKYRKMRMLVAESRIQALQAQINPHFIGNSINAIQQFFYPPDPARASKYIAIFTRLLRKTMEFTEQHFIPLKEELQYTEDYLQLAQLRYEDHFSYQIECEEHIPETTPFPGMILQPLLENATIHAMTNDRSLFIAVKVYQHNNRIVCTITDNGPGIERAQQNRKMHDPHHQSRGLDMIKKKIQTLNTLHHTDITMAITDRSHAAPQTFGTVVEIAFTPKPLA